MQHRLKEVALLLGASCLLGLVSNEMRRWPVRWFEKKLEPVSVGVAKSWWVHRSATFVDLRPEAEYRALHIAGARRVSAAGRVVYYGGTVSEGFVLEGGFEAWRAAGGPVE